MKKLEKSLGVVCLVLIIYSGLTNSFILPSNVFILVGTAVLMTGFRTFIENNSKWGYLYVSLSMAFVFIGVFKIFI